MPIYSAERVLQLGLPTVGTESWNSIWLKRAMCQLHALYSLFDPGSQLLVNPAEKAGYEQDRTYETLSTEHALPSFFLRKVR